MSMIKVYIQITLKNYYYKLIGCQVETPSVAAEITNPLSILAKSSGKVVRIYCNVATMFKQILAFAEKRKTWRKNIKCFRLIEEGVIDDAIAKELSNIEKNVVDIALNAISFEVEI